MLADKALSNAACLSWHVFISLGATGRHPTIWLGETRCLPAGNTPIAHRRMVVALCWIGHSMSSSLEDRIRLLTDRAIAAKTQSELDAILPELKGAIRRLRTLSACHRG